ncbi:MAG: hypothetical protein RI897_445 [Verrucomicrobiota bacterium]
MPQPNFQDATLILVGHGATDNPGSTEPLLNVGRVLRKRGIFGQVLEGFYRAEPSIRSLWDQVSQTRVFVCPLTISEGWFTNQIVPRELGLKGPRPAGQPDRQFREGREVYCCVSLGDHPLMTELLIRRAREALLEAPGERPTDPKHTAVFVAGHGTKRNKQSRQAIEDQVERIQHRQIFGEVHPTFMLEEPLIADCWKATRLPDLVLVPFFMANGLHTLEDIPVMLGVSETEVRERLRRGDATWLNPTSQGPQRLWYTPAIGSDPALVDLVMERVLEAEALPQTAGQG